MKSDGVLSWDTFYRSPLRLPADLKRVLVIDDLESFRHLVSRCLTPHGISVKEATTGEQGISIARAFKPDVIILDWVLKEVSGENVARSLREDAATKSISTIMVSSVMDPSDAHRARAAGAHLFLTKDQLQSALISYGRPAAGVLPISRRVLVIEDDEGSQEFIRHSLSGKGCELIFAQSGRSGLQQARLASPALILLDLGLPDLNGVEVFKALKADISTKDIPVLVMTAMADNFGALESLMQMLRPTDFLHKPFGADEFAARVLRILASSAGSSPSRQDLILKRGRIQVNLTRGEVHVEDRRKELTPQLLILLRLLISHQEAISVEKLLSDGWPTSKDPNTVKKTIQRLREALRLTPDPIASVGHGYKLVG
jgi:DNA-binding response OmpR family regulator